MYRAKKTWNSNVHYNVNIIYSMYYACYGLFTAKQLESVFKSYLLEKV